MAIDRSSSPWIELDCAAWLEVSRPYSLAQTGLLMTVLAAQRSAQAPTEPRKAALAAGVSAAEFDAHWTTALDRVVEASALLFREAAHG